MAVKIVIPREGQSMETALITEWSVKVGDTIEFGDVICEVESEKASFPIESPVSGEVLAIFFDAGAEAPVLETIAVIGKSGEDYEHLKPGRPAEEQQPPEIKGVSEDKKAEDREQKYERAVKKKMSPKARRAAKKEENRNTLTGMRKAIAENILQSVQSSAQFTLHFSADAENLLKKYRELKADGGRKVSLNDILLYLVMRTLAEHLDLNATYDGSVYSKSDDINLGFAVDVPEGLVVPVIKKAQELSLRSVAETTASLVEKCRVGRATAEELSDGTFTVSNLGMFGIGNFTPILNYPEVGILGIGGIFPRAMNINGRTGYSDCIDLSLTLNHQVIDGVKGARFLNTLADKIRHAELDL